MNIPLLAMYEALIRSVKREQGAGEWK